MAAVDLMQVDLIADEVHTGLPERREVFEEKLNLFPAGCQMLVQNEKPVGYGISHPWVLYTIPPLDAFLGKLPTHANCLYVHDVVVLPEARGRGAAPKYIARIVQIAGQMRINTLALTSVYGSDVLWSRLGFRVAALDGGQNKLASYGDSAKYMLMNL